MSRNNNIIIQQWHEGGGSLGGGGYHEMGAPSPGQIKAVDGPEVVSNPLFVCSKVMNLHLAQSAWDTISAEPVCRFKGADMAD